MIFELVDAENRIMLSEVYFSIGGGVISTISEISKVEAPLSMHAWGHYPFPFESAESMLSMSVREEISTADMKRANGLVTHSGEEIDEGLDALWSVMEK